MGAPTIQSATNTSTEGREIAEAVSQSMEGRRQRKADELVARQAEANIRKTEAEADAVVKQMTASKMAMGKASITGAGKPRERTDKYIPVWNQYKNEWEVELNPDIGYELPEAVGGAEYAIKEMGDMMVVVDKKGNPHIVPRPSKGS